VPGGAKMVQGGGAKKIPGGQCPPCPHTSRAYSNQPTCQKQMRFTLNTKPPNVFHIPQASTHLNFYVGRSSLSSNSSCVRA